MWGTLTRRLASLALLATLAFASPVARAARPMVTIELPPDAALDAPDDWTRAADAVASRAFLSAPGMTFEHALHPVGSRVSDLPYAIVERTPSGMAGIPTGQQQADLLATFTAPFAAAMSPPSKADRPPAWVRSKVSPVRHDRRNGRFEFEATLSYDSGGDRIVRVAGLFGAGEVLLLNIWSDAPYADLHAAELGAMQSSFRFAAPVAPAAGPATVKERFLTKARWLMGFVILGVIGLQVFVLVRERRERRAAGVLP